MKGTNHACFLFVAETEPEMHQWIESIARCLERNTVYERIKARCPGTLTRHRNRIDRWIGSISNTK